MSSLCSAPEAPRWQVNSKMGCKSPSRRFCRVLHRTLIYCSPRVQYPTTQHISSQYHIIFDDAFATVPAITSEVERNKIFEQLYATETREYYIDAADADAGRIIPSNDWDWDLPAPKAPEGVVVSEGAKVSEGGVIPEGADVSEDHSDGASVGVIPEPAPDEMVEVELDIRELDGKESHKTDSPLHQNEQRPSPSSPPRYNLRRRVVTALLTIPQYTLTAASSWYQPPASVANVGT